MKRHLEIEAIILRWRVIKVKFYSGYKGEEKPSSFEAEGEIHLIVEVIERKIIEDYYTRRRKRYYLVKTDRGEFYELRENGDWRLTKLADSHFA